MLKYAYILFLLLLGCKSSTSPSLNDSSSIEPETFFAHNISSKVAFYFFESIKIKEDNLSSNDWVGAFKGQICVGVRRWNTCDASACEIPIYGENELNELTTGYMLPNEIPTFIIYDASEEIYYDAISSDQIPWQDGIFPLIDSLITG
tara:strand:- start:1723 stop:2166 length:444 start_codon:yes stop_codon:yes gene_type:complete